MNTDSTDAAWAAARAGVPDDMSRDELVGLLGNVRVARSWLDAAELRAARRVRELQSVGQAEPADSMIANTGGRSGREARSITDRDELCEEMPAVEDALADGEITAGYVDAMAKAVLGLPEAVRGEFAAMADQLLARAERLSLDAFGRECRQLARHLTARAHAADGVDGVDELAALRAASKVTRWVDRDTGMHHTHLELDPIRDAKLHSAAQTEVARLRTATGSKDLDWTQLQLDAFVNTIAGIATPAADTESDSTTKRCNCGRPADRMTVDRVPEITALVSYDWLIGQADNGICETENGEPLPISTIRRLCCDAEIIPTMLDGDSEVLDEGRSKRTASRPQRRALRAMHRGCAHPDCNIGFDACRIHHIRWWWRDLGRTDLDNLLPLCERHHHLVHQGGWTLTMTPDRISTWQQPDGTTHHHGPTIDRIHAA
jgi:hypothetical protein